MVKIWKQLKCPEMEEWSSKLYSSHLKEYFEAILNVDYKDSDLEMYIKECFSKQYTVNTTLIYHFIPTRMTKIKKTGIPAVAQQDQLCSGALGCRSSPHLGTVC